MTRPSVLFVCLGNICRSPMAEGALRKASHDAGIAIDVDSAGTGDWHIGRPPDPRAQLVAREHGIDIAGYRARQVTPHDFLRFDHILALDLQNLRDLKVIAPAREQSRLELLMDLVPGREGTAVADPYFGDEDDFRTAWNDVVRASAFLIERLAR
ncbi:low molecular weight protein-tyrosine-phosphatase [Novosphingobium sp. ZN18A2]|uniref:low molecular weight protein-tyrosine-phosphatase n=1 Tax=Novosphingobium sp. ZN18A2 TaxID=3079861 RepID=UPI0030D02500